MYITFHKLGAEKSKYVLIMMTTTTDSFKMQNILFTKVS